MTPTITDDDKGTITATVNGKIVRSWQYTDPNDQNLIAYATVVDQVIQMAKAREYAEGWHNCTEHLKPFIDAVIQDGMDLISTIKS